MNINSNSQVIVHFVGIGGIGMSGIAEILLSLGYQVTGSDLNESAVTEKLKELGAVIYIGHQASNIKSQSVVVHTSAAKKDNPELLAAHEKNIPIMRRAEMLAELMRLKQGIAVAGTHGKTTTTSMLATILEESRYNPTYVIGGIVRNLGGHAKVGQGDFLVAEADESDGSFLLYQPYMSVITNIDEDHLDHYGSKENLVEAFNQFANQIPFYGVCALNAHDELLMSIREKMKKPVVTFGMVDSGADYQAVDIKTDKEGSSFDFKFRGENLGSTKITLPGKHNVLNALGALSIAHQMGVKVDVMLEAISKFSGVGRRLERLANHHGFELVDDYGHHPTEVAATLGAVVDSRNQKPIVIFEPHRYSRTKLCWNQFIECFDHAKQVYLCQIYPASEAPIEGITSSALSAAINARGKVKCDLIENKESLFLKIDELKNQQELVVSLGAGSIGKNVREWVKLRG
ncbi:MAG: UDP-N-acetylmuramate--L-alanine ligase [Halobacteriovorax sp.]|nr:UDP-N-acetylmuramate--L-alanine ligase [Halobacteriovorax sp.]